RFWNEDVCLAFLEEYRPQIVVEIGGYDGGLAAAVLPQTPFVDGWLNMDLLDLPQVCEDPRYVQMVLKENVWSKQIGAHALILSQTIEHFSEAKLRQLLSNLNVKAIYVDTPLPATSSSSWYGTETAHILPLSMMKLDALFLEHDYRVDHASSDSRYGFESQVRWYTRS